MIPKYIFETRQQTLNNLSVIDKLYNYRMYLYYILKQDLKKSKFKEIKYSLINEYKIKTSEIDYELQSLKQKEIYKNKNTQSN